MKRIVTTVLAAIIIFIIGPYFYLVKLHPSVEIAHRKIRVEVAETIDQQIKGLSGRDSLSENQGMIFLFQQPQIQNFWMKDMKFPLDIIWINGDRVIGWIENAPLPAARQTSLPIYSSVVPADKVLEVNAGSAKKWQLKVGDKILFIH